MNNSQDKIIEKAKEIAEHSLRQCYFEGKILASLKNFSDFWARDTFWAMPGVLKIGDYDVAKNCFEFFLAYQKPNGLIPRKVALDYNGFKYLFKKSIKRKKPRAIYKGNIPVSDYLDGNALMTIAFLDYLEKSSDTDFAVGNYEKIKKAVDWYESKKKNRFVQEHLLANWMDTIFKNGAVLYTNVLYCRALESFSEIAKNLGNEQDRILYFDKYTKLKDNINKEFWNGSYFDDELGHHKHFDTAGNVVACYFNIAPEDKIKKIVEKLKKIKKEGELLPTVFPRYPFWRINPLLYFLGFPEYQNGISWLWIDLFAVAVKFKNGCENEALEDFGNICRIIVKNRAVHETYYNTGKPFDKLFWKSAVPFAWNSGIFLEVYDRIMKL